MRLVRLRHWADQQRFAPHLHRLITEAKEFVDREITDRSHPVKLSPEQEPMWTKLRTLDETVEYTLLLFASSIVGRKMVRSEDPSTQEEIEVELGYLMWEACQKEVIDILTAIKTLTNVGDFYDLGPKQLFAGLKSLLTLPRPVFVIDTEKDEMVTASQLDVDTDQHHPVEASR